MRAKDLKNSILQLAVSGKLVPQDASDEPAVKLLERIRAERESLIKQKKIKNTKVEPITEEDIPFEVPESWEWVRLGEITTYIQRGKSPKYSDVKEYPVVAQKCNQWSGFSLEKAKFIDPATVQKYAEERVLRDGDLLWNSTGLGTLGRMAIYQSDKNKYGWAVADSHVTVIRTIEGWLNYQFAFIYFAGPSVQSVIEDKASGTTKQKELATDTVKNYPIPLPPLAEQKRICKKVQELMPLVEEYGELEEAREKLDAELPSLLKKSVLQQAVQGKLVPQDDSDEPAVKLLERIRAERNLKKVEPIEDAPFEIPSNWVWVKLETLCDYGRCKNIDYKDVEEGTWNLDLEDIVKDAGIFLQKKRKQKGEKGSTKHVFKKGMVLYSKLRPYLNKVVIADEDGVCSSEILSLNFPCINAEYAQLMLMEPNFVEYAKECSYGVKMPRLGTKDAKAWLIPLPPLAEQKRIVQKVQEVMGIL